MSIRETLLHLKTCLKTYRAQTDARRMIYASYFYLFIVYYHVFISRQVKHGDTSSEDMMPILGHKLLGSFVVLLPYVFLFGFVVDI